MDIRNLPPSALVAVDISRRGGCHYTHRNEIVEATAAGGLVKTYDGEVALDDPIEYKAASKIQGKVKRAFSGLGVHSAVGIICPADRLDAISKLDGELSAMVAEFNGAARFTRLDYTCLTFSVEGDNVKILGSMLDGLGDKLVELEKALKSLEPQNIRQVLAGMTGYLEMLPTEAQEVLGNALKGAKRTADTISRGSLRLKRLDAKLAELAPGQDALEALERLQGESATREMTLRARAIQKVIDEKGEVVDKIEKVKTEIDSVPVSLARFVCMREVEIVPESTEVAAEVLARFAGMTEAEEIMTASEQDAAD
jgi:hypothetical protein